MTTPTINPHVHVDQALTQMLLGYRPDGLIADRVAPIVSVGKQSDFYLVHDRANILRDEDSRRAPGTEANLITQRVSSGTYFSQNYALKRNVTIEDRANADPMFRQSLIDNAGMFVVDKLYLGWEIRLASLITVVANVGSGAGVASAWTDLANSDPLGNLNTAIFNIQDSTGMRPTRMTVGHKAWRNLRRHDDVRNLIFGSNNGGGYASAQQVAALLDLDEVLVGGAYRNSANQNQAEALEAVWGDHVVLHFSPQRPSMEVPSAFYSFRWAAAGLANLVAERHPFDPKKKTEEVEVGYYQDEKVTGPEYAFVLRAVNSST